MTQESKCTTQEPMNSGPPDFTIVTPSYNYREYVRDMLDSVAAQKGASYEHLVYDAGSTDGTLDVISEYGHVHLTVEPDEGMSDAINKGFKAAKGRWVMWLNTDDRLKPGALAAVKKFADGRHNADVIYGAWDFIGAAGDYQRTMGLFPFRKLMLAHYGCYIGSTATFFKRVTTINEGYLLNERFQCVMDGEYYNRLAGAGKKFVYMPTVLADFRMHGENISQKLLGAEGLDSVLSLQLILAESRTIRRVYGVSFFKSDHLNSVVDALLFYGFKAMKFLMKLPYRPSRLQE